MQKYDVAAYIWPAYTGDEPRSRLFWPEGMGEWQTVKAAQAKFAGHEWPRRPLWGYCNEADPYVMEGQISCALDHGVNVFIYDWYWYDDRPFLEQCLDNGFLKAKNAGDMRFYLMWANHDAMMLWDKRNSGDRDTVVWRGGVTAEIFRKICVRNIEKYFKLPNYYTVNGCPVFMIYDVPAFVRGMGGVENARRELDFFREECVRRGLPGLHLQFAMWNERTTNLSGVDTGKNVPASAFGSALGFDSATHYQFVHFTDVKRGYTDILRDVAAEWERLEKEFPFPYFPHISMGWDNNPRFIETLDNVMRDTTPENIEKGLRMAKAYADAHPQQPPLITLNSWNEWTETSYLQPDDRNGYGYLETVRRVFKQETEE